MNALIARIDLKGKNWRNSDTVAKTKKYNKSFKFAHKIRGLGLGKKRRAP